MTASGRFLPRAKGRFGSKAASGAIDELKPESGIGASNRLGAASN